MNFSIGNAEYFNKGIWHIALGEHDFLEGTFAIHANYLWCLGQSIHRFCEKQNGCVDLVGIDEHPCLIAWSEFFFIQDQFEIVEL